MPSFTVYKGSKDGSIHKSKTERHDLKNDDVLVRITASGVCGTDEHYRTHDMVLGHEGAGVVQSTGPGVRNMKRGDRVGWGYLHDSCGNCRQCLTGKETFCSERKLYGEADLDQGSFATHGIWRESFLFRIPDSLSDKDAAPLMCGGATVFGALRLYDIQPTARIGIIGIGGLGHLAIQFAQKMGADVVVFSGTNSKQDEAKNLGAHEFYATKGVKEIDIGEKKLDALLVTTSFQPDWNIYLPLMAPESTIFPLSVAEDNLSLPYMTLLMKGICIQGSMVAPRQIHIQMLEFAARNNVKPMVQTFPMSEKGISEAMETLKAGNMRYRGVLLPEVVEG